RGDHGIECIVRDRTQGLVSGPVQPRPPGAECFEELAAHQSSGGLLVALGSESPGGQRSARVDLAGHPAPVERGAYLLLPQARGDRCPADGRVGDLVRCDAERRLAHSPAHLEIRLSEEHGPTPVRPGDYTVVTHYNYPRSMARRPAD